VGAGLRHGAQRWPRDRPSGQHGHLQPGHHVRRRACAGRAENLPPG
jgi:hypothetical protein